PELSAEITRRVQPGLIVGTVIDHVERKAVAEILGAQRVFAASKIDEPPILSAILRSRDHLEPPASVRVYVQRLTGPLRAIGQAIVECSVEAQSYLLKVKKLD